MKFYKKTVTLRLPLWLLILLEVFAVLFVAVLVLLQTSIPKTMQLHTLRPNNVASAELTYVGWGVHNAELTDEADVAAAMDLINKVHLPGKPYTMSFVGGGPSQLTFTLKDGSKLTFGTLYATSYYYFVDGEYYYICSDGRFAGEGVPREGEDRYPGDLDLYNQWEQLYISLCEKYLGPDYDQRPAQ